jgi:hypothetical protein
LALGGGTLHPASSIGVPGGAITNTDFAVLDT